MRRQTTNTGRTAKQLGERLEALLLKASKTGKLSLVDIVDTQAADGFARMILLPT